MGNPEGKGEKVQWELVPLPRDQAEALDWLLLLIAACDAGGLMEVPLDAFWKGWFAIAFLYPGLHPDATLENGTEVMEPAPTPKEISSVEPRLAGPSFTGSGWPVVLVPIATEAWRRYEAGELQDEEFYCSEATLAGMSSRNPELARVIRRSRTES